jgi:hypothetical protein
VRKLDRTFTALLQKSTARAVTPDHPAGATPTTSSTGTTAASPTSSTPCSSATTTTSCTNPTAKFDGHELHVFRPDGTEVT